MWELDIPCIPSIARISIATERASDMIMYIVACSLSGMSMLLQPFGLFSQTLMHRDI